MTTPRTPGVEWRSINLNDTVRVRLTDIGREHHRKSHEELFAPYGDKITYVPPKVDADGWSEFQHWQLMHEFGAKVGLGMNVPFETSIQIAAPDTVSADPEAGTKSEGRSEPDLSQAIKERDEAVRLASEMADLLALATTPERFGEAGTGDVYLRMVAAERKFRAFLTTMEWRSTTPPVKTGEG